MSTSVGEQVRESSGRFFLVLIVFFSTLANAQVPGYMGKKFAAGYGFNVSPSINGANPNDRFLNMIHEIYVDAAVGTKWTIGPCVRFYKTLYDNKEYLADGLKPEGYYTINGLTVALNFKYYKKNYLAPWGSYFMMSPVVNMARTSYDPYMHIKGRVDNHDTLYTDFGPQEQMFYHVDIMLGWGRNRIIADRVCIDYGFNVQLLGHLAIIGEALVETKPPLTQENYIDLTHTNRVRGINLFNVFLKVGYLF